MTQKTTIQPITSRKLLRFFFKEVGGRKEITRFQRLGRAELKEREVTHTWFICKAMEEIAIDHEIHRIYSSQERFDLECIDSNENITKLMGCRLVAMDYCDKTYPSLGNYDHQYVVEHLEFIDFSGNLYDFFLKLEV